MTTSFTHATALDPQDTKADRQKAALERLRMPKKKRALEHPGNAKAGGFDRRRGSNGNKTQPFAT